MDCKDAGQDASSPGKLVEPCDLRFKRMDQVVQDRLTGAIWSRNANPAQFPLTWQEAHEFVADMRNQSLYGYDNWQLPSRSLLFSLISHQNINPALPEKNPFNNIFPGYYWASETVQRLSDQAWYIHLGGGRVHKGMKHGSYMLWPVSPAVDGKKTGTGSKENRFETMGLCVHDNRTGLIWAKDADLGGKAITWQKAIKSVEELNRAGWGGRNDWRLPNIRQLESLIDLKSHSPALPQAHPFLKVQDVYWSSTTSVYEPRYAWALYTQDGIIGVGFKTGGHFHLWPVAANVG